MALTTQDVLREEFLRSRTEEITMENLMWRNVFRDLPAQNIDGNVIKIRRQTDNMGLPQPIGEGEEFPMDEGDYEEFTLDFEKYGFSVPVTMEAVNDTDLNVVADQVDQQARNMARKLNNLAFNEMSNNLSPDGPVTSSRGTSGQLDFYDITEARSVMRQNHYEPNMLIVNIQGQTDIMQSDKFLHATDLGDRTLMTGSIGQVAGMDVMVADDGNMGNTAGAAYMIDSNYYGYEVVRDEVASNSYESPERQATVYQLFTRRGYHTTDEYAGIRIDG